ncbi:MAG: GIY-YIG nuclease family protein [Anaerolineae bacterium]
MKLYHDSLSCRHYPRWESLVHTRLSSSRCRGRYCECGRDRTGNHRE